MSQSAELAPSERIAAELAAVEATVQFRWFHGVALLLSLFATLGAWQLSQSHSEQEIQEQFDLEAVRTVSLLKERMGQYEDALWSGVSAIRSHGHDVDLTTWQVYASSERVDEQYEGTNGIGVIHEVERAELDDYLADQRVLRPTYDVHPAHDLDTLYPITYIEPAEPNAAAIGLDMAHENNRLSGILLARDTATAQVTGPITLVQDEKQTPGFLFYAPFYASDEVSTPELRRENFLGAVYAPFIVDKLMSGLLDEDQRQVGIKITDLADVLYDEHVETAAGYDPDAEYRVETPILMYGRVWTLDLRSTNAFSASIDQTESYTIVISGLALTLLLLYTFLATNRSNRRALRLAEVVIADLRRESDLLEQTNIELANAGRMESIGQLAAGVAHEINTPVQFISDNTDFLAESFGDLMHSIDEIDAACATTDEVHAAKIAGVLEELDLEFLRSEVPGALSQSKEGIDRVANIVRAMKDFSHPGVEVAPTDLNAVIESTMAVSRSEWKYVAELELDLDPELPPVTCSQGQLKQVILNMVVNAAHAIAETTDNSSLGVLRIGTATTDDYAIISIGDTGAGMTEEVRAKIFERFFTTKGVGRGTGQGLALAWDVVVSGHRGMIDVDSTPGVGTTFTIKLPLGETDLGRADVGFAQAAAA